MTLTLADLTRHAPLLADLHARPMDTTSAEWILEAPGNCWGSRCVTLPLVRLRPSRFSLARVVTGSGRTGSIAGAHWHTTRITLTAGGPRFVDGGPPSSPGGASPGALTAAGSAFSLSYTGYADQSRRAHRRCIDRRAAPLTVRFLPNSVEVRAAAADTARGQPSGDTEIT